MRSTAVCVAIIVTILGRCGESASRLAEVFHWNTLQFEQASKADEDAGRYVPANNLAVGLEHWHDKLFVAVPRLKPGVFSTLNYIALNSKWRQRVNGSKSPVLIPYPSLEANTIGSGSDGGKQAWPPRLVSVVRARADACDRLWALDSGTADLLAPQPKVIRPPRLLAYDLKSDQLVLSYPLKEKSDYNDQSFFPTITVDVTSSNCDHAFAYLPDVSNSRLVVYSLLTNDSHSITHNYFHFDPLSGDFSKGPLRWQWQDGIFGISLSPVDREGFRIVYFHALASTMEFAVSSKYLQNASLSEEHTQAFKVVGSRGPGGQSSASVLDEETGVIFYPLVNKHAVSCWNSFKGDEYDSKSLGIVAEDEETMSFPNDVKVDKKGNLWVMSTALPELFLTGLDPNSVNMRVFMAPVRNAIKGTVCDEL